MAEISKKLIMVRMPNFISVESPPRPRQEGFNPESGIPVGDLPREVAEQYAEEMKQAFLAHWNEKSRTDNKK